MNLVRHGFIVLALLSYVTSGAVIARGMASVTAPHQAGVGNELIAVAGAANVAEDGAAAITFGDPTQHWGKLKLNADGDLEATASTCVDTSSFCGGAIGAACSPSSNAIKTGAGVTFWGPRVQPQREHRAVRRRRAVF